MCGERHVVDREDDWNGAPEWGSVGRGKEDVGRRSLDEARKHELLPCRALTRRGLCRYPQRARGRLYRLRCAQDELVRRCAGNILPCGEYLSEIAANPCRL